MSGITCDQVRVMALDPGAAPADWARRPDVAAHVRGCTACEDWLDAFAAGEQAWVAVPADDFTARVMTRTSGVDAVLRDLPSLADMDPGPGFTERVLRATSQKPAAEGWRARASGAWWLLVRRPRFAWEAAYLVTVCWVLLFGNPVGAFEWSAANLGTVARERLAPPVRELRADLETWRGKLAPEPAPSREGGSTRQADPLPPVVQAWQAASDWLRRVSSSVFDAIARAWDTVGTWFSEPANRPAPPPAEPGAAPVRSRQ